MYHAIKFNMHDGGCGGGGQSSREEPHVAQEAGKTDHKAPPTSQTSSNLNRETDWWLPWLLPTRSLTQRQLTSKGCKWLLEEAALLKTACIQRTNASVPCNQIQLSMRASNAWRLCHWPLLPIMITMLPRADVRDKRKCTMQSISIVDAREQGMALISLGDQQSF